MTLGYIGCTLRNNIGIAMVLFDKTKHLCNPKIRAKCNYENKWIR